MSRAGRSRETWFRVVFLGAIVGLIVLPFMAHHYQPSPPPPANLTCAEVSREGGFWNVQITEVTFEIAVSNLSVKVFHPDGATAFPRTLLTSLADDPSDPTNGTLIFQQRLRGSAELRAGDRILAPVSVFSEGMNFLLMSDWGVHSSGWLTEEAARQPGCCCIVGSYSYRGNVARAAGFFVLTFSGLSVGIGVLSLRSDLRHWFSAMMVPIIVGLTSLGVVLLVLSAAALGSLILLASLVFGVSLLAAVPFISGKREGMP